MRNPILDFEIDKSSLQYIVHDLQRPECILAEPDGTLWSADARGGVMKLRPDGTQEIVTQKGSGHFSEAGSEAARYLEGTLPNGLAFARNGDILISTQLEGFLNGFQIFFCRHLKVFLTNNGQHGTGNFF